MKKFCLLFILLIGAGLSVNAESTVNVFVRSLPNPNVTLYIEGEEVCDMNGTVEKIYSANVVKVASCYRAIKVKREGEVTFKVVYEYTVPTDGSKKYFEAENTLTLTDGETYNLNLSYKGLKHIELAVPKEKDVQKWTKEWEELPTVTYPKDK